MGWRGRIAGAALVAPAALLAGGCPADGGRDGDAFTVRDSAGVEIVESVRPQWRRREAWRMSATPVLEVGGVEGVAEVVVAGVAGAVRRPDGGVVVASGADGTVRFHAPDGRFEVAHRGFAMATGQPWDRLRLQRADGGLYATAPGNAVNRFDLDGRRLGLTSWEGLAIAEFVGVLADGRILLRSGVGAPPPEGETRWVDDFRWLTFDGEQVDTIAQLPMVDFALVRNNTSLVMFGGAGYDAVGADTFVHGFSSRFDIGVYDGDGRLLRRIRRVRPPVPVTQGHRDRFADLIVASRQARQEGAPPAALREMLGQAHAADTLPAHGVLLLDGDGHLWVQPMDVDTNARMVLGDGPRPAARRADWDVFDPDGVWLGSVTMPPGFMPLHIADGYVTGVHYDESGVQRDIERVRVYRLQGR